MSLADELLADLEENDEEVEEEIERKIEIKEEPEDVEMDDEEIILDEKPMDIDLSVSSIRHLCKLRDSQRLSHVLSQIEVFRKTKRKTSEMIGSVESDPEYQLIVEANNVAVDIDNEISIIHKYTKDKYQKRFPELDSLIMGEMDYIRSVRELGNDLDQAKNNEKLQEILTQATIMIVSVTASTTQG